ncbi:Transposon Ty3-G Gag-Pol polyprotein [Cucumis melo var. makuwa]|uniref:Transposon Ty3-G Gag-Pol polyprotein n=1 Tax=Cucumis melo var. makuwa TaxID=1194695 RepID=A0A5A7TAL8_CUCMM|nr:Transposon Ty3-G Gag-Pol polyprotein [Cucumis melo var. makuwa]TYK14875.1 Transposon Ty3-G Gag-Pol polyprotein [Cucumis melo var. makuwa]
MENRGDREKENEAETLPALWQAIAKIGNRLDEHFERTNRDIQEIQRSMAQMNANPRGAQPQNRRGQQPRYVGGRHGPIIEEENNRNSENDDNSSTESDEFVEEAILRANWYERERPQQRRGENNSKVKLVAYKLKGGASAWWEQLKHYQQRNRSVREYTTEFSRLNALNNLNETPTQQVARYVGGLKSTIQDQLSLKSMKTLSKAITLAQKAEAHNTKANMRYSQYRKGVGENNSSDKGKQISTQNQPTVMKNMGGSSKQQERIETTANKNNNNYARANQIVCYKCNQKGHRSSECPLRKQVNLVEEVGSPMNVNSNDELDPNEIEENVCDEGDRVSCVIQKVLLLPK